MQREALFAKLDRPASEPWDFIIIGGGAVGAGTALAAVARGYSCVLLEQRDFGKGTSSRSTKLIHGGVRYLAQGNVALVRESLRERGLLLRNAASIVRPLQFVVPCYSNRERWYYWAGMKCYDMLAGELGFAKSRVLSNDEARDALPTLRGDLHGGVLYADAQFNDTQLLIAVLQQVARRGGVPLNYCEVTGLIREGQTIRGVAFQDLETGASLDLRGRVVINAAGPFSDRVRRLEDPATPTMLTHSQGVHLVVDSRFASDTHALMIPKTRDGRVLFAIPWLGRTVLGTTDTPVGEAQLEPRPLEEETEYLLEHFADYLNPAPGRADILSIFAGLRPLVKPQRDASKTSKISREHRVLTSPSGLVSVLGGKWTTFRKMGEDVIDVAERVAGLAHRPGATESICLDDVAVPLPGPTDAESVSVKRVHHACDHEFARSVEDVLARRSRLLLLDARRSLEEADTVGAIVGQRLGRSAEWIDRDVDEFKVLARGYLPTPPP